MALDYASYILRLTQIADALQIDVDFVPLIASVIDFAEQRCYRELDLLNTVTVASSAVTANNRNYTLPSSGGRFVVVNGINAITPSTQTVPNSGTRNPLTPMSRDILDILWGSVTGATLPTSFAMITDQTIILGPWPDAAYTLEVIGTIRPTPLSSSNTTTYLTNYLPDLFLSASGAYMCSIIKNSADAAWEQKYITEFNSANIEEQRKRFASGAWGSLSPTPIATPGR